MNLVSEVGASWDDRFDLLVRHFAPSNHEAARSIRGLLSENPSRFSRSAARLLVAGDSFEARQFVAKLLISNGLALSMLSDPDSFEAEPAVLAARRLAEFDPALDRKLAQQLQHESGRTGHVQRIIEILAAITPRERIEAVLVPALHHSDPGVRALALPLLTEKTGSVTWALESVAEPDGRIRAAAIRALWGNQCGPILAILHRAAQDSEPAVAANALAGLYKAGIVDSLSGFRTMAGHPDPEFRAAAADAIALTGDSRMLIWLKALLRDSSALVRGQAIRGLAVVKHAHARRTEKPTLVIEALKATVNHDEVDLWVRVLAQNVLVRQILATHFSVWCDSTPLIPYAVQEATHPAAVAIGFGLWPQAGIGQSVFQAAERGLDACLELKLPSHAWSVVKVSPDGASTAEPGRPAGEGGPANTLEAAVALIETSSTTVSSRHVVILVHPGAAPVERYAELLDYAMRQQVWLHVVCVGRVPPNHPLRNIPGQVLGTLHIARTAEEVHQAYLDVYGQLSACYRITFRKPAMAPTAECRLEIDDPAGFGSRAIDVLDQASIRQP